MDVKSLFNIVEVRSDSLYGNSTRIRITCLWVEILSERMFFMVYVLHKVQYKGSTYFIKGRMATGYAILMDIEGNKVELKPIPQFSKMQRVSARKSWITVQKIIPSFYSCVT